MEGLLSRSQLEDEMSENSYNELVQAMEMECLWYGDEGDNLFKFDDFNKRRRIKNAFYPLKFYNDRNPVPSVGNTEERILSVDVALMQSTKKKRNDASAIFINNAIQVDNTSYSSNFVYAETFEGKTTDELGIIVMRYYYHYKCTQLVLDCQGVGLGVYDFICKDHYDSETGNTYKALCACNNDDMAVRCKVKDARRVVWCVKADAKFNSDICVSLRNGIQNGKVSYLVSEEEGEEVLKQNFKGYSKLSIDEQVMLRMPYVQTTMTEYELIKLDSEVKDGKIKVKEISGMRKDRYSSTSYSFWCVNQLELKLKPKTENVNDLLSKLRSQIRPSSLLKR